MVFEYSYWWILPMLSLSGAVAYLKFRKISKLPDFSFGLALFIASLRFLVTFILLVLLLNPALSFVRNIEEKPLLIVAGDNSVSIPRNKDSLYYQTEYKESLNRLIRDLERKFDVEYVNFGRQVTKGEAPDFSENYTDISAVFDYAERNFLFRHPAGMVLLTDGIYNSGANPRYKTSSFPVYTVLLGDTSRYPDVYVKHIESNKFNFIHTFFPVKASIAAQKLKGKRITCVLLENDKRIAKKTLDIGQEHFLTEVVFEVEAKRKGIAKYTVAVEAAPQEQIRENNRATVYTDIIDNTGEVAIYYDAPHPDVAAIVNAVNVSGLYKCSLHSLSEPVGELKANLVIFHNPEPTDPNYQKLAELAAKRKTATWYILTTPERIGTFARFGKNFAIDNHTGMNEYATVGFNKDFPYFEFTDEEVNGFMSYPPLVVPFGELKSHAGRLLFTQRIRNTPTSNGIIGFYENNGNRVCYFWGEGLWRWRLYSYKEFGNHELFNTLIHKITGYLAAQKGTDRFIHDIRPLYDESEEVVLNVELYNDSYELVNQPDVTLNLKSEGKDFDYILNRNEDKYRINLGNLAAGEYGFRLATDLKGEHFEKKGVFYVRSQNTELNNVVADRQLLQDIATRTGGQMVERQNMAQLPELLNGNERFDPVYKSEVRYMGLSEWSILGLILILLLCTEWFLLKYFIN